jgi:hypothetical protein
MPVKLRYIIQDHYMVVGVSQLPVEPANPKNKDQEEKTEGVDENARTSTQDQDKLSS